MRRSAHWVSEPAEQMPTILAHWDGLPTVTLSKIGDGARLLWLFDDFNDVQLGVFVHLTSGEAQFVYDTPPPIGLLEEVRSTLADRTAYVWRTVGGAEFDLGVVSIPAEGSEYDFSSLLLSAAMSLEGDSTAPELEGLRRSAEAAVASTLGAAA